ncbi:MAG: glycosyltransferase [Cytophagaceae bacterium]
MTIVMIILGIIFTYLAITTLYSFIFSVAGRLGGTKKFPVSERKGRFAVMIPAYKEDEVIIHSAREAVKQNYPKDKFEVVVIADSLKKGSIETLRELPLKVIEVSFDSSTKAKSLNKALSLMEDKYDFALVLDADNIMEPDFLTKLNNVFQASDVVGVQGHRVAKNLNTDFAVLDGISEEVNNHIFRKGHRILGLSCGIIGSGMAFRYEYFKNQMKTINAVGGFDKELELKIFRDKQEVEYMEDALVYDEKVPNSKVFGTQRRRWISAQFHYFGKYFFPALSELVTKGNLDFFNKAFQQFLLPRALLLGVLGLFASISLAMAVMGWVLSPFSEGIVLLLLIQFMAILIAVPGKFYNKYSYKALVKLPKAILIMFITLFKLKGANKKFIHTPHSNSGV